MSIQNIAVDCLIYRIVTKLLCFANIPKPSMILTPSYHSLIHIKK